MCCRFRDSNGDSSILDTLHGASKCGIHSLRPMPVLPEISQGTYETNLKSFIILSAQVKLLLKVRMSTIKLHN